MKLSAALAFIASVGVAIVSAQADTCTTSGVLGTTITSTTTSTSCSTSTTSRVLGTAIAPTPTSTPCSTSTLTSVRAATVATPVATPCPSGSYGPPPSNPPSTPPAANGTANYAVLFEGANYAGIKHWIDGQIGECRGLSTVPVNSVKMTSVLGGDPFINPSTNNVVLAFYNGYNCAGSLIGTSSGDNTNTNFPSVYSVRFFAPGTQRSQITTQSIAGTSSSASSLAVGVFSVLLSLGSFIFAL